MDGMKQIFPWLVGLFILIGLVLYTRTFFSPTEGFADISISEPLPSEVETTIRKALDPYLNKDLCDVYTDIRASISQTIQGDQNPSTPETIKKIDARLTTLLTLPPLPCPAFTYPEAKSEVEWITFLNEIPVDIGARFLLMVAYAQRELHYRAQTMKAITAGKTVDPNGSSDTAEVARIADRVLIQSLDSAQATEGFESIVGICPMSVADTRRAEHAPACMLPEDLSHEEIVQSMKNILAKITDTTKKVLAPKFISPDLDVKAFLKDAKENRDYLNRIKAKALDGSLVADLMASKASP